VPLSRDVKVVVREDGALRELVTRVAEGVEQLALRPVVVQVSTPEVNAPTTVNVPPQKPPVVVNFVEGPPITMETPQVKVEGADVKVQVDATLHSPDEVIETETVVERGEAGLVRGTKKVSKKRGR
jgi:hypothetical protein